MQITHDDDSPVLQYVKVDSNSTWVHDSMEAPIGDGALPYYFGGTMTRTTGEGNYMIFTFNGTSVYVYGSKRPNHGIYSVTLDDGDPLLQSGKAPAPGEFQALLYQSENLDPDKEHNIVVTNLPSRTDRSGYDERNMYLDIDYVVVETATSDKIYTTTVDDTSPDCQYVGTWGDKQPRTPTRYYNTTAHYTSTVDSSVTCSFNGSSVQLLGSLYSEHGNYSVSLDGGQNRTYHGTLYTFSYQVPLFTASGLDDGPHTVTLTNGEAGKFRNLDFMIVNSTIQPGTTPAGTGSDSRPPPEEAASNTGAIVGGAVGGAVGMLLLVLLARLLWRRSNKKKGDSAYMDKAPLDLTGDEVRPFRNNTTPPVDGPMALTQHPSATTTTGSMHGRQQSANTGLESVYGHVQDAVSTPYLTNIPPPPSSSHASYPPSSEHTRSPHVNPYAVGTNRQDRSTMFTASEAGTFGPPPPVPHPDPSPITQSYKSMAAAIPFTARRPSTLASSEEQSTIQTPSRMFIPGREMDAGPLSPATQESHELEMLPPDYHQATEPLPGQRPPGAGL